MDFLIRIFVEEKKKIYEMEIMDKFRQKFHDFPKGKVLLSESPDFVLKLSPKQSIGIELTRLSGNNQDGANRIKEGIADSIRKKGEKLKIYRKKRMDFYWLIITMDHFDQAAYSLPNKIRTWKFQAEFDRIFLFNCSEEKIYELKLRE